jgi:uncharacterized protein YdaU (DUF1376 family)
MNYYRRYMGDYLRDTGHLSMTEHGAYCLMLDYSYATEKPLPADPDALCRLCRALSKSEQEAVRRVAGEFFELRADGYHNSRADHEIAMAQATISKQRESGVKTASKRWAKDTSTAEPTDPAVNKSINGSTYESTDNSTDRSTYESTDRMTGRLRMQPPTTNLKSNTLPPFGEPDVSFAEFWQHWPKSQRKGSRKECLSVWTRRKLWLLADEILRHVEVMKTSKQWQDQAMIPAPLTYLNQSRWDGAELPVAGSFVERRLAV